MTDPSAPFHVSVPELISYIGVSFSLGAVISLIASIFIVKRLHRQALKLIDEHEQNQKRAP